VTPGGPSASSGPVEVASPRLCRPRASASCKTRSGTWRQTLLDNFAGCLDDISNNDGTLTCPRCGSSPRWRLCIGACHRACESRAARR
jgi:hypothetical protein